MRILAITSANSGVGYHRLMLPLVHMKKTYLLVSDIINDEILEKGFDIVAINRVISNVDFKDILAWRIKYGFKLIVDNDDYWELPYMHQLYFRYKELDIPNRIVQYIREADLCTCTHDRLAAKISEYNSNIHILPNALPYGDEQFIDKKIESDKLRIFWSGSATHYMDMKLLKEPMKRLINEDVQIVVAGYNEYEKDLWNLMVHYASGGNKLNTKVYRYDEVYRYMAAYCDSDISIIPLEDNLFNSMKSNLKVLETASKKNPAIVSCVHPYLDMPVQYVKKQSDWYKHLKNMINDESYRIECGQTLYDFCHKNYNFKEINSKRESIYNQLCL